MSPHLKQRIASLSLTILFLTMCFTISGQTTETGMVKEYRGSEKKAPLAGVELMVKGAPSTVSDGSGKFALRFTTLVPGAKVEYTEIYKDGFVVFNRDALEAWRISNNGRPFTIVMCRESDLRNLRKKFYGIIEKSYLEEYNRQKEIAKQHAINEEALKAQLKKIEDDYNEKLGNINTYVDLFSRIDLSEIGEVESKVLQHVEMGEIDDAIALYESLNLKNEADAQMSKLEAAEQMKSAAETMEDEAINDLLTIVEKLRQQMALYEMGGGKYRFEQRAVIDKTISLMRRLNELSSYGFNEELGALIIQRSKLLNDPNERLKDYREAAALPSSSGLFALANHFELIDGTTLSHTDSIKMMYDKAATLVRSDSLATKIKAHRNLQPDGVFTATNGLRLPYRIIDGKAHLASSNFYYSTPLEGDVELPSQILVDGKKYTVTEIDEIAFYNNPNLKQVKLPRKLSQQHPTAFEACDNLKADTFDKPINADGNSGDQESAKKRMLKEYLMVAQLVAERERDRATFTNFRYTLSPEEVLSIAILAVTEVIKDKTQEELDQLTALRLSTITKYAIWNELNSRYEWYDLKNLPTSDFNQRKETLKKHGLDEEDINFLLFCTELHKIGNSLKNEYITEFIDAGEHLKGDSLSIHRIVSSGKFAPEKLTEEFSDSVLKNYIATMRLALSDSKLYAFDMIKQRTTTNDGDAKKKIMKRLVETAKLAAKYEHERISKLGLRYDYDELFSIALISAQALLKQSSIDKLQKQNEAHWFTMMTQVIADEMEVRYPEYAQLAPRPESLQKGHGSKPSIILEINSFKELYLLSSHVTIPDSMKESIALQWDRVQFLANQLDPKNKAIATEFFAMDKSLNDVLTHYTTDEIYDMIVALSMIGKNNR